MIDILLSIFFGVLIFLSAIAMLAIVIALISILVWLIVEIVKDIFD